MFLSAANRDFEELEMVANSGILEVSAALYGDGKIASVDLAMLRRYLANADPFTGESTIAMGPK